MKFLGWIGDHFPFLLPFGFGAAAAVQGQAEIALGFFAMGLLGEVLHELAEIRKALRHRGDGS
jgi:hypothetical protein